MSKTTHTKGPWFWNAGESPIIIRNGDAPGDIHVCTISGSGSNESSKADAALIAAAPDLLAACREAMKWPEEDEFGNAIDEAYATPGYRAFRAMLRAAVAKAEG